MDQPCHGAAMGKKSTIRNSGMRGTTIAWRLPCIQARQRLFANYSPVLTPVGQRRKHPTEKTAHTPFDPWEMVDLATLMVDLYGKSNMNG